MEHSTVGSQVDRKLCQFHFKILFFSVTVPSLFHLVQKDFGSKLLDQNDEMHTKTIKHISKWTDSEIAKIDHDREIRKLR